MSTVTLSFSPGSIIGLMSTGRVISGRALTHSRRSKTTRLRDRFLVATIRKYSSEKRVSRHLSGETSYKPTYGQRRLESVLGCNFRVPRHPGGGLRPQPDWTSSSDHQIVATQLNSYRDC